jgi:hypothetical protein
MERYFLPNEDDYQYPLRDPVDWVVELLEKSPFKV